MHQYLRFTDRSIVRPIVVWLSTTEKSGGQQHDYSYTTRRNKRVKKEKPAT
jgi:hypothetical protein